MRLVADLPPDYTRQALHSHKRVEALVELNRRYGSIIHYMGTAIAQALAAEGIGPLGGVLKDAEAQVTAADDALRRAFEDLPEGDRT